jgi:hypothetical protein
MCCIVCLKITWCIYEHYFYVLLHKDSVELDENEKKLNGSQIGLISLRRAQPNLHDRPSLIRRLRSHHGPIKTL